MSSLWYLLFFSYFSIYFLVPISQTFLSKYVSYNMSLFSPLRLFYFSFAFLMLTFIFSHLKSALLKKCYSNFMFSKHYYATKVNKHVIGRARQ